jgi:hypothetical protein
MHKTSSSLQGPIARRALLRGAGMAGVALSPVAALLAGATRSPAQQFGGGGLHRGDVAILSFLAAAEIIETDLWVQYAELGGIGNNPPIEVDPNEPLSPYQAALSNLDPDGPQYITSNTLDEATHANFINAYLAWKGEEPVDLDPFRTLQGSTAPGSSHKLRLTNLMHLDVDTSWFVRYRSATNPDFGATYPQAVKISNRTAIPITSADFADPDHIQVIANTAAFHFGAIEQGGSSLYAAMSQKVRDPEVLQITLGIGGDEIAHFLEWVDFAGNGVQAPVAPVTDDGLTFPNFFDPVHPQTQPSLIFPVPCEFISPQLPHVAVIRPLTDEFGGAMAAVTGLTNSGLFTGQSQGFFELLKRLAKEADEAHRG